MKEQPALAWNEIDSALVRQVRKQIVREVGDIETGDVELRELAFALSSSRVGHCNITLQRRIRRQFASSAGEVVFLKRGWGADLVNAYLCVLVKPRRIFEAFNFVDREDRYYLFCEGKQIAEVLERRIPSTSDSRVKRALRIGAQRVWEVSGNRGQIGAITTKYPVDARDELTFVLETGRKIPIRVSRRSPGSAEKSLSFKKYWSDVFHGRMPMIEFKDLVIPPASLPMDAELAEIYFCLSIMMRTCYFEFGGGVS